MLEFLLGLALGLILAWNNIFSQPKWVEQKFHQFLNWIEKERK